MREGFTEKDMEQLEKIASIHECRLPVIRFAREMERVLRENDFKGGWEDCSFYYLKSCLVEEVGEYFAADYAVDSKPETKNKALKELVDIANFCMMLYELRKSVDVK